MKGHSWRKQGKAWRSLLPFPQHSSGVVLSLVLEFQCLPPPSQAALCFCSSLNLLFSQPLLPIKLDIRNIHQPGCVGVQFAISVHELLDAITQMDLNFSKNYLKASCFHLCRCWSPITLPNKPLNSLIRSQQRNPMLLSFGVLTALYFSSFGGDGGGVYIYHFIRLSSQDSFLLKTQISL